MPKGPQGQKRPADVIGNAVLVMKIATGEITENGRDAALVQFARFHDCSKFAAGIRLGHGISS